MMTHNENENRQPSLPAAARKSGISTVDPDVSPTAAGLLAAVGGLRGLIESFVPGLTFLILYTVTHELLISVLVPVGVALIFVAARAGTRSPITPAVSGAVGIALTALLAILTNRPENNFLPGIIINAALLAVILISLIVRWPLLGIIVGALLGDNPGWRDHKQKRRALTIATWVWAVPSAIRVSVQLPLYLASQVDWLAGTKLLMGLPLYAGALWVTWLLVRTVYARPQPE